MIQKITLIAPSRQPSPNHINAFTAQSLPRCPYC